MDCLASLPMPQAAAPQPGMAITATGADTAFAAALAQACATAAATPGTAAEATTEAVPAEALKVAVAPDAGATVPVDAAVILAASPPVAPASMPPAGIPDPVATAAPAPTPRIEAAAPAGTAPANAAGSAPDAPLDDLPAPGPAAAARPDTPQDNSAPPPPAPSQARAEVAPPGLEAMDETPGMGHRRRSPTRPLAEASAPVTAVPPAVPVVAPPAATQAATQPSMLGAGGALHAPPQADAPPAATVRHSNAMAAPPSVPADAIPTGLAPPLPAAEAAEATEAPAAPIAPPPGPHPARPTEAPAPAAPPPPAPPPSATPARQIVPVLVSVAIAGGTARLSVSLEPAELGRVEISVERHGDTTDVRVAAERPETLALLQRDQRELDRALTQAGIASDGRSLSFALSDGGGGFGGGREGDGRQAMARGMRGDGAPADATAIAEAPPRRMLSLLDLAV